MPDREAEKLFELKDVGFSYGGFDLKDISFHIYEGDFISIIGRNGSGKSTLVKLLSRIIVKYEGEILYNGRDITEIDRKDFAKGVSYLPQSGISIDENIRVYDFLLLGLYPYKNFKDFTYSDRDREIVNECLETAGISNFKERHFLELSGGERQKVLITLALVQLNVGGDLKGKVLIVDEPLTYLDVNYQHEIFGLLHRLNKERGLTVITVIHDLNVALKYTGKSIVMNDGRIVFNAKTGDVITEEVLKEHFLIDSRIISYNNETLINFLPKA